MTETPGGAATARVTWLGHATVLLELGRTSVLTDPVLRPRVAHLRRHSPPPAVPEAVDVVLISHAHHDHLDRASLRRLGTVRLVVVPRGVARALRRVPARRVLEVSAGDTHALDGVAIRAVRAAHDGRRAPGIRDSEALGFLVEHRRLRIYFAGDTERFDGMGGELGPVDLALVPVWGWGTSLGAGHMDPEAAARAVAELQPRVVVPIHWGTFLPLGLRRRHGHLLEDPGEDFARHAAQLAPGVEVRILRPGDAMLLAARA